MRNFARWAVLGFLPVLVVALMTGDASTALAQPLPFGPEHLLPLLFAGVIGKASDLMIYQEEFQTGLVESVTQFLGIFNGASRGAIRLVPRALRGHFSKDAFFKDVAGLVSRRDITSTAAATILPLTQDEVISVKLNRKIGPVAQTLDAMKKAGMNEGEASRVFGVMAGQRKMKDMVNTALIAVETALQNVAANNLDITGETDKEATTKVLARTIAKLGDNSQNIVCWLSHSTPNAAVLAGLMATNVTGLTDVISLQGSVPAYLGRPVIVTDSPALWDLNGSLPDTYNTLGLVADAVVVEESEEETYFTDIIPGAENLYRIFQAEYAYNVKVKGFKWDVTNGGINPSDSTLATTSNWDKVVTDDRDTAGVRLVTR